MKLLMSLALVAMVGAAPQFQRQEQNGNFASPAVTANGFGGLASSTPVAIISHEEHVGSGDGSYSFKFETADGVKREESGYLKTGVPPPEEGAYENDDGTAQVQQGSYSFTAKDGTPYTFTYIADENGFRVEGDHLPTPPPIPAEIQRVLDASAQPSSAPFSPTFSQPAPAVPTRQSATNNFSVQPTFQAQ